MALDVAKLKQQQEELDKQSSNLGKNWIQASKITDPIDIRIMDPLPSMDGVYYVAVPRWWINGVGIISSKLFGPTEPDVVEELIEEAKKSKDPTLKKLLAATNEQGMAKIQRAVEFWIPALKLNWELDANNNIKGITDSKGNFDPELIRAFIEDDKIKILVTKIQLLKAINEIATKRGGGLMTDQEKGFDLILSKSGERRKTKYAASKSDILPMPKNFYTAEAGVDPFEIAQSMMYTDEYCELIINNYLYGEELPDRVDEDYAYPEIREKLKAKFNEEESGEETPKRSRPSIRESKKIVPTILAAAAQASTPARRGRPTATTVKVEPHDDLAKTAVHGPVPGRGRGRNLVDDLAEVN